MDKYINFDGGCLLILTNKIKNIYNEDEFEMSGYLTSGDTNTKCSMKIEHTTWKTALLGEEEIIKMMAMRLEDCGYNRRASSLLKHIDIY